MRTNSTVTIGTWDIMKELWTNDTEIICWHMFDLKLKGETDGIFTKEIKTDTGELRAMALLVECELVEHVICKPDEVDEWMEMLNEAREVRIEYLKKCELTRLEIESLSEDEYEQYFIELLNGDDDYE